MDLAGQINGDPDAITCIDMHTTGEPTRIVIQGYPEISGTLLEQRAKAKQDYDHIRRMLVLEPRGHRDMYGAILRSQTEHTISGDAHMGVLFLTNSGYSTMCGHATIALGRFLLHTHDKTVFPRRDQVKHDPVCQTAKLVLHAPCGLIEVTVPVNGDGSKSDPSRPVTHVSVPSFATGVGVCVDIPKELRWPELGNRPSVFADFSYGGAFYCFVSADELGFPAGLGAEVNVPAMDLATKSVKAAVNGNADLRYLFSHPDHEDLGFLYSIIIRDESAGVALSGSTHAEAGLCFFSDQQIDRSPTGSAVAARIALRYAKDRKAQQDVVTYHSLVSLNRAGRGGFIGRLHQIVAEDDSFPIVRVQVEGYASYTGTASFIVEDSDSLGDDGFLLS